MLPNVKALGAGHDRPNGVAHHNSGGFHGRIGNGPEYTSAQDRESIELVYSNMIISTTAKLLTTYSIEALCQLQFTQDVHAHVE